MLLHTKKKKKVIKIHIVKQNSKSSLNIHWVDPIKIQNQRENSRNGNSWLLFLKSKDMHTSSHILNIVKRIQLA